MSTPHPTAQRGLEPPLNVRVESPLETALSQSSHLPSWITLLISGSASALFEMRGEADAYAPLLLGLGVAFFWSRRRSHWISGVSRWIYLIIFSLFIWERSLPHEVYRDEVWAEVDHSLALMACSALIYAVGVAAWFMDRRRSSAKRHAGPPQTHTQRSTFK